MSFIDYFQNNFSSRISEGVEIKFRNEVVGEKGYDNNLGNLYGVELESSLCSGYIYFWDKGFLDFCVIRLESSEELLPTKIVRIDNYENSTEYIGDVIKYFSSSPPV